MTLKNLSLITLVSALAGCSLFQPEPGFDPGQPSAGSAQASMADPAPDSVTPPTVSETIPHTVDSADVAELWDKSESARQLGDYTAAIEYLNQALKTTPNDPVLLSRLAELQLRLSEYSKAESTAVKSNAVAQNNTQLLFRNWLIVEYARNKRGDLLGAQQARKEAAVYRPE